MQESKQKVTKVVSLVKDLPSMELKYITLLLLSGAKGEATNFLGGLLK